MNRVLIIGLDGASPHLIAQWRERLPHLSKLIDDGASGVLHSVIPPRSIPAWYCFATGMNPAKLGVFGFSQRRPGTYDYTFANFTHCQAPPFWEWLGRQGIRSAILHLPGTFPPRPLHGVMLSGWPAPLNQGNLEYTYPAQIGRDVDAFLQRPFEFVSPREVTAENDAEMLPERLRILHMHADAAVALLQRHPWQAAVVVLSPLDRASHQFWRHMDAAHPRHDPAQAAQFGDALQQVYAAHDAQVGRLLSLLDEQDTVFIVSDHGFGPVYRMFYLNEWLRREGYLTLKDEKSTAGGRRTRWLGRLAAPLFRLNERSPAFRRLAAPFKKRALSNFIRDEYVRAQKGGLVRINHLPVDWSRTVAYCPDESMLYLNLKGRDPQGIVTPGAEAEAWLQKIEAGLRQIVAPLGQRPLAVRIQRKEKVYSGAHLDAAPEMIISLDDHRCGVMAELQPGKLWDTQPIWSGNHTMEGAFIAAGPHIAAGKKIDAGLMDIAPTVLHLLGAPAPAAMDGRVLLDIFQPGSPPRQRDVAWDETIYDATAGAELTPDEQAQIEKQLRDLGYLN